PEGTAQGPLTTCCRTGEASAKVRVGGHSLGTSKGNLMVRILSRHGILQRRREYWPSVDWIRGLASLVNGRLGHDGFTGESSIGEDRKAAERFSFCDAAVFDRWRANAGRQSGRVLVYGVFGHFFRCSGIGRACGRRRVCCIQSMAEHSTGRSALPLWIRANHVFLSRF